MDYLVVSEDRVFLVSGHNGDVVPGAGNHGLYFRDTRHLSRMRLLLNGLQPTLLSFDDEDAFHATILLGNARFQSSTGQEVPPNSIGIRRERCVADALHERITLANYNPFAVSLDLLLDLAADFADIFMVRGYAGDKLGGAPRAETGDGELRFVYQGNDAVTRATAIRWSMPPDAVDVDPSAPDEAGAPPPFAPARARLRWRLELAARAERAVELAIAPSAGESAAAMAPAFAAETARLRRSYQQWSGAATAVVTDNPAFDTLLARGLRDLRALTGSYPTGPLPHAGIPWFAAPFGRDSLIASLQTLCLQPDLAAGTLRFLAAHQGTKDDPWRDEHPGKIMHELRFGELAGTGAVPHTPYYGTIDATLLFLMLFARTLHWTGDAALYHELKPAVLAALDWIDRYGDRDGDGYVEFAARSANGLRIQGWKDSGNSLLHPDGSLVEPPITLVEVQAYVYAAKTWVARVFRRMGEPVRAEELELAAAALKEQFNRDFWLEEFGWYAQALDADERAVPDLTSNPGHALMCDILPPDRAAAVARRLREPDLASGWGIRTRASSDPNYNPMSYHNGSVWPHDTSLIIYGLARSGQRDAANDIAGQVVAAAATFPRHRLPELMCGFGRESGSRPADYPVSCSPQAWAAGTPYLILESLLGLEPDAFNNTLHVDPRLPAWLGHIEIRNLRVGPARVHLGVTGDDVEVVSSGGADVRVGPPAGS